VLEGASLGIAMGCTSIAGVQGCLVCLFAVGKGCSVLPVDEHIHCGDYSVLELLQLVLQIIECLDVASDCWEKWQGGHGA